MASKGHSIANAQGFFLKHEAEKETDAELKAYVAEKMNIIDDFFDKKNKLKAKERKELEKAMLNIKSKRGIDLYFRTFIDSRI